MCSLTSPTPGVHALDPGRSLCRHHPLREGNVGYTVQVGPAGGASFGQRPGAFSRPCGEGVLLDLMEKHGQKLPHPHPPHRAPGWSSRPRPSPELSQQHHGSKSWALRVRAQSFGRVSFPRDHRVLQDQEQRGFREQHPSGRVQRKPSPAHSESGTAPSSGPGPGLQPLQLQHQASSGAPTPEISKVMKLDKVPHGKESPAGGCGAPVGKV